MLPTPDALLTTMSAPLTNQRAGVWSCAETHSFRLLPSKRTIASDGAAPTRAPGVTTGGTGLHTSVSLGFSLLASCAIAQAPSARRNAAAKSRDVRPEVLMSNH